MNLPKLVSFKLTFMVVFNLTLSPYKYLCFVFKYLPSQDLVNNPESLDMFLPWSKESKENCKVK